MLTYRIRCDLFFDFPGRFLRNPEIPAARLAQAGPAREIAKLFLGRAQAGQGGRPGQKKIRKMLIFWGQNHAANQNTQYFFDFFQKSKNYFFVIFCDFFWEFYGISGCPAGPGRASP